MRGKDLFPSVFLKVFEGVQ